MEKVFIRATVAIVAILAWHFFPTGGNDSSSRDAAIGREVMDAMQQQLYSDPNFTAYHLVVVKVDVVKQADNRYEGIATVHGPKRIDHGVPVHITTDGDKLLWDAPPGSFVWAAMEQASPTEPMVDLPQ